MSQAPVSIDPRLLGAVKRALGRMPGVPYDLTQVKALDNFYTSVDPYWETVPECFALTQGDFSVLGQMTKLRRLTVVPAAGAGPLDMGDYSWLPQCKNLQQLDLAQTTFSDCALLLGLSALKAARLPRREQLTNLEALSALPQSVRVQLALAPQLPVHETVKVPPSPSPRPMLEPSEKAQAIVAELQRRTARPCWKLTLHPEGPCGLLDSKIGGLPYWDPALPYPTDPQGGKMALLAQLNFPQLGTEEPLPQEGLLQFFLGENDTLGADFEHLDQQSYFRVIYHPQPRADVTREQVEALGVPTHESGDCFDYFPVCQEAAITAEKTASYMGPDERLFPPLFREVVQAVTGENIDGQYESEYLDNTDHSYLFDQLYNGGHRLLGWPYFFQGDPRGEDSPYDTLLFQLDSDMVDREDLVLWGDCGVGTFLINQEDLLRRDFSRVLYYWDCC